MAFCINKEKREVENRYRNALKVVWSFDNGKKLKKFQADMLWDGVYEPYYKELEDLLQSLNKIKIIPKDDSLDYLINQFLEEQKDDKEYSKQNPK